MTKDVIKRYVTSAAKHLSTRDYEGIVNGVKQIPLMYFEPDPQATGSDEVSVVHPAVATTQYNLPKPRKFSKKTSSISSASSSKPESNTARHVAAVLNFAGKIGFFTFFLKKSKTYKLRCRG